LTRFQEEKDIVPIFINFSAQTNSMRTQQAIEGKLEKKKRTLFGAAPGKKIAIFVDDINMPATETYGAQPPIELLRSFIDMKGLYDRDEWMWKDVEDTTIVAASAPPGGGRSPLLSDSQDILTCSVCPMPILQLSRRYSAQLSKAS